MEGVEFNVRAWTMVTGDLRRATNFSRLTSFLCSMACWQCLLHSGLNYLVREKGLQQYLIHNHGRHLKMLLTSYLKIKISQIDCQLHLPGPSWPPFPFSFPPTSWTFQIPKCVVVLPFYTTGYFSSPAASVFFHLGLSVISELWAQSAQQENKNTHPFGQRFRQLLMI